MSHLSNYGWLSQAEKQHRKEFLKNFGSFSSFFRSNWTLISQIPYDSIYPKDPKFVSSPFQMKLKVTPGEGATVAEIRMGISSKAVDNINESSGFATSDQESLQEAMLNDVVFDLNEYKDHFVLTIEFLEHLNPSKAKKRLLERYCGSYVTPDETKFEITSYPEPSTVIKAFALFIPIEQLKNRLIILLNYFKGLKDTTIHKVIPIEFTMHDGRQVYVVHASTKSRKLPPSYLDWLYSTRSFGNDTNLTPLSIPFWCQSCFYTDHTETFCQQYQQEKLRKNLAAVNTTQLNAVQLNAVSAPLQTSSLPVAARSVPVKAIEKEKKNISLKVNPSITFSPPVTYFSPLMQACVPLGKVLENKATEKAKMNSTPRKATLALKQTSPLANAFPLENLFATSPLATFSQVYATVPQQQIFAAP